MAYDYLLTWEEALRAVGQTGASDRRYEDITDALRSASDEIQALLDRNILSHTDKHWIEYHERDHSAPHILRVLHWPIDTTWGSLEIAEDSDRDYGSSSLLTSGTDYRIVNEGDNTAKIIRLDEDSPVAWESGYEAIRITFKGGWTPEDVPTPIKRVCREFMSRQYHALVNQSYSFSRVDDARGSVTTYGPVMLTAPQRVVVAQYADHGATTCVRYTEATDS